MDAIDRKILRALARQGRLTNAELAEEVGLSASPCWTRVKRLEQAGVIRGYEKLLRDKLYRLPGVRHTRTSFALRCLKRELSPMPA